MTSVRFGGSFRVSVDFACLNRVCSSTALLLDGFWSLCLPSHLFVASQLSRVDRCVIATKKAKSIATSLQKDRV